MSPTLTLYATAVAAGFAPALAPDGRYTVHYPCTPRVRWGLGSDAAEAVVRLCRLIALAPGRVGRA